MSATKKKVPPQEYNRIIESIKIFRIYLKSSKCLLRQRTIEIPRLNPSLKEKYSFEVNEDKSFVVDYTFILTGKMDRKKVLEIECCYSAEFESEEEIDDDFLDILSKYSVRFICFPYAREFFSSITSRMDIPAFYLPLFKIGPPK